MSVLKIPQGKEWRLQYYPLLDIYLEIRGVDIWKYSLKFLLLWIMVKFYRYILQLLKSIMWDGIP